MTIWRKSRFRSTGITNVGWAKARAAAAGFIVRQGVKHRAVMMFGSLKTLVSRLVTDVRPPSQFDDNGFRLATAALLIRVATVDREMSEARRGKLRAVLKSGLELDDSTTVRLIADAAAANRNAIDLYHFTRQLNDILDDEGRRRVVKMMWQIIYVDGGTNEFENNIIWRAADLLGVPARQRIELRQQIAADSAALVPS